MSPVTMSRSVPGFIEGLLPLDVPSYDFDRALTLAVDVPVVADNLALFQVQSFDDTGASQPTAMHC